MATGLLCGFETGDLSEAASTAGTLSVQATITRGTWSKYALRCNPTGTNNARFSIQGRTTAGVQSASAISVATIFVRFYIRIDTLPASNDEEILNIFDTGGSSKLMLRINSAGKLAAYTATPTLIATGTAVLSTGIWYRIELKGGSGAGAVVEWKVATGDGAATTDVSTTTTLGSTNYGFVQLGKVVNRNGNTVDYYYDDVLVSTSAYPGAGRITCLLPNANGNYQTWTIGAGSGSHFQIVNERPPDGDTSYLLSPLILNDFESEALTDSGTANVTGTVNSVMSCATLKQNVSGGTVRVLLRDNGTDDTTAVDYTATAAYVLISKIYDTSPATGIAWTPGNLDGCETGAEDTSAVNQVRMTWTALMVDFTPPAATSSSSSSSSSSAVSLAPSVTPSPSASPSATPSPSPSSRAATLSSSQSSSIAPSARPSSAQPSSASPSSPSAPASSPAAPSTPSSLASPSPSSSPSALPSSSPSSPGASPRSSPSALAPSSSPSSLAPSSSPLALTSSPSALAPSSPFSGAPSSIQPIVPPSSSLAPTSSIAPAPPIPPPPIPIVPMIPQYGFTGAGVPYQRWRHRKEKVKEERVRKKQHDKNKDIDIAVALFLLWED